MTDEALTTEHVRQTFAYVQAGLDDDDGYPFVMHVHVEAFDAWLSEVERAAAEKAWDEGYGACWTFHTSEGMQGSTENPHRREEA